MSGALAQMMEMAVLDIPGVTDGQDNDYVAQIEGALEALREHDLVVVHIEAPDEASHDGSVDKKVAAIEKVDSEVLGRVCSWESGDLRVLIMPDHPTPIKIRTHCDEPVPFLLWGSGFGSSGAATFSEAEGAKAGNFVDEGYKIMERLIRDV